MGGNCTDATSHGPADRYVARVRVASRLRRVPDLARSAAILVRRGLVRPLRPGETLAALRVARRAGPFAAMIVATARSAPATPAVVDERRTLSYGELDRLGTALARGLADLGVRPSGVAGLLGRDSAALVLALVAAGKLGVRVALLNTGLAGPQLADVVRREGVTALLVDTELWPLVEALPAGLPRVLLDGPGPDAAGPDAAGADAVGPDAVGASVAAGGGGAHRRGPGGRPVDRAAAAAGPARRPGAAHQRDHRPAAGHPPGPDVAAAVGPATR